jgi:hypothetical protein
MDPCNYRPERKKSHFARLSQSTVLHFMTFLSLIDLHALEKVNSSYHANVKHHICRGHYVRELRRLMQLASSFFDESFFRWMYDVKAIITGEFLLSLLSKVTSPKEEYLQCKQIKDFIIMYCNHQLQALNELLQYRHQVKLVHTFELWVDSSKQRRLCLAKLHQTVVAPAQYVQNEPLGFLRIAFSGNRIAIYDKQALMMRIRHLS